LGFLPQAAIAYKRLKPLFLSFLNDVDALKYGNMLLVWDNARPKKP